MTSSTPRVVLHVDMDAFYASIEQRDRPELRGHPVVVGATSGRGVVAAASYEARSFGVHSAMPGFRARELCPQAVFLAPDMKKYARVSAQIHRVFEEFTDAVEPLALDEAFLDITGSLRIFGDPLALAQQLKRRVQEETSLPLSCGLGPSKLVAKIACRLGKPNGLKRVRDEDVRALLDPLPLRWLWGIGKVTAARLREAGLESIGDLACANPRDLRSAFGERAAALIRLARGEDEREVEPERAPKSYGEENTFARDVTDRDVVTSALSSHAQAVAARLRHDHFVGRTVVLRIKLARARRGNRSRDAEEGPDYPLLTRSKTLSHPTDDGALIRRTAIGLWDAAALGEPVRLLGVSVQQLSSSQGEQLDLFDAGAARARRLGPAIDAVRARFGEGALRYAAGEPAKLTPSLHKKRGVDPV